MKKEIESKVMLVCVIIVLTLLTLFNVLNLVSLNDTSEVNYYVTVLPENNLNISNETSNIIYEENIFNEREHIQSQMLELSDARVTSGQLELIYNQSLLLQDKYGIPKEVILSIISTESTYYSRAYNKKSKATGLMQICKPALDDYNMRNNTSFKMDDMFDIENNMEVGTWNIRQQMKYLKSDNMKDAIIAYNTGVGDFKRYKEHWYNGVNIKNNSEYKYFEKVQNTCLLFTNSTLLAKK